MDEILTKKIALDDLTMLHDNITSIQETLEHNKENIYEKKLQNSGLQILKWLTLCARLQRYREQVTGFFIMRQFLSVYKSRADADVLTATVVVERSCSRNVVVISNDIFIDFGNSSLH